MSGNERSTKQLIAVTDCRDLVRPAAAAQRLPSGGLDTSLVSGHERGRRAAAFASGGVLVVGAVAALHNLYRSGDDAAELIAWSGLLLLALTALGGGIKFAMWGARPVIAALFNRAEERLAEPVLAVVASGAVIVGASGMWWTLRGGYAGWWQQVSGEGQWSLSLGVGQMLVAVLAGAALFTGGRYVTGLVREALTESGLLIERDRAAGRRRVPEGLWHPGLVAALVGGGLALVVMTAWLTPKLAPTIAGANVLAAVAAIVAVLVWGVGANLGWWKGLAGLWKWATDASHKTAAMSGVVALLMFSAGGLGLGWFTQATVPQAHAQCPPDCGGGSNGGSYGPDASQFQPPQMPSQMPDYQGGINQPPLDQNGSISIYNTQAPSVSNEGVQGSSGQQGPQQSWDQPAHGTQIPDYQNATPYTQGPGRPNPDFNPGSDAGSQGVQPNQGAQQPVQQPQQASQQPPQQDAGQQPSQSPNQSSDQQKIDDLTRQLQDQQQQSGQDRQRIDDLSKQLQQQGQQRQNGNQKLPKAPSRDKKQDDKDQQQDRDDQSGDNDLSALLLGAASTRRRKQDEQDLSDQRQPQGPDTQALAQDGAQLGQSLPGDIANTVSDSVNLGQSAGSAAQNFGSAAQAGASLASSAQSGAVNPMDAVALVQGVSGGISDTADAVGSGASIASTWINNAGQGAQLAADANPQLEPQAEQVQQLTQAGGQVADLTGQVAGGVSQVSGVVNTVSSLGASGMPNTSGVGDAADALSGTATAVNGPGDIPKPPTPPVSPSTSARIATATDATKPVPSPGDPGFIGPVAMPEPSSQPFISAAQREFFRKELLNTGVPADQVDKRLDDLIDRASKMPVPRAENYQPSAPGPADDISPQKFFEGLVGRGVDEFKSNWQLMKTADPMISSVRGIIDPQGLAQDRTQMTQGLAPLVGAGGDNAPGVGESWTNVGKDAISYDEWKDGNPVKAAGQNAFDVLGAIIGGRGINNAARAPESAVTQGALERAVPVAPVTSFAAKTDFTAADIDVVAAHLGSMDPFEPNDAMISRIRDAISQGKPLNDTQVNFMRHELTENSLMKQGMAYEAAHAEALTTHPPGKNYDLDLIQENPLFGRWWKQMNGLLPK
ncbi:hypothetical protein [Mycobacteroides abscessus]|uniref:hypothetical protein n=1 Tax=Mycobacteroides abscessus TaxID=36809 RepID=UPI0009D4F731|nr:hypothetical protein [Mycobacteroides abscessus]SKD78436.1 Uncharacterised protein [Mycobacteroides abscessus subsp. massiliense]MBE5447734.1 hypothetical protein [Mycobacteroides abscessus]MBE5497685.1 hypothetical protein [Mycobacteroides abscessus]MBE5505606.1 hypothetical protein [Mycobacteroides abscessus]